MIPETYISKKRKCIERKREIKNNNINGDKKRLQKY